MNPFGGMALVLGLLSLLVAAVKTLKANDLLNAESSRKMVHMGMGVVCLLFPWIFQAVWPVWTLALLACGALLGLRFIPLLRNEYGSVLHGVERKSWGELYFPLGVAAVFTLADGQVQHFVIPVALLTFADAAGALIGRRWGRHHYVTLEGTKSIEGSLAVGVVGAMCALVPLLFSGIPPIAAVLMSLLIGLFGLLLEAISWRGLDNAFLPLAAYAQVSIYVTLPVQSLVERLVALVVIAVASLVWRRGHFVDDSARFGAALALFFFWTTGGWLWLMAPAVLLVSYARLMPIVPGGVPRHNLVAVICVASSGLIWCVANAFAPDRCWLWPYTLGLAAQQAVIAVVRFSQGRPAWGRFWWWLVGVIQAAGLHLCIFGLTDRGQTVRMTGLLIGAATIAGIVAGFVAWDKNLQMPEDLNERWWRQGLTALTASAAGFFLIIS